MRAESAPPEHFEVASIKPGADVISTKPALLPGRIRWTTDLCRLIVYANHLARTRVSGAPCGNIYSLEATFDPASTDAQVRLMLQSLLAERFKLKTHLVSTEVDGYNLTVAKGGFKANKPVTPGTESSLLSELIEPGVIRIRGRSASMEQLAEELQRTTKSPVRDKTGLAETYNFSFQYADHTVVEAPSDLPNLVAALQDNLGLKMEKGKGTVESLVIDHLEALSAN